mmetsp:Transcript_7803/g.28834  ORF Transcript_7803/g.28834 Transcript_7803/m.28834 type:complete len:130 (-) Transcript_7803:152-541(-)
MLRIPTHAPLPVSAPSRAPVACTGASHPAAPRDRRAALAALVLAPCAAASLGAADVAKAYSSRKKGEAPEKSEYELMMEQLQSQGGGGSPSAAARYATVKPKCRGLGTDASTGYASTTSKTYICKSGDE